MDRTPKHRSAEERRPAGTRVRLALLAAPLLALVGIGCGEHEFEPPDRAAQVESAGQGFSMALYDSVAWVSDSARSIDGNIVWSSECRTCHGPLGRGQTSYAAQRGLEVPSLVEPDWRYANQRDSVLFRIHAGHAGGMPTWSVAGISPREIDAVAYYLLDVLRPEVIGGG